jgi:hypothetical protein|tara:strand:+ start:11611 stop:12477 length:867 start_codon:yes stop_codon:yes gene_type:complete
MYARKLANEVVARPGEEPCATYDARPLRPASENARVMKLWRAMGARDGDDGARGTGTGTGTTARARDAVTVLKALAVMPCEAEIARRREARMDPWTRRATTSASDDEAEETRATKRGGKRAKSTTGKKASGGVGKVKTDERSVRLREVAKEALKLASEATRLRAEQNARFTETRNFAGKMVEVETEIVEGSKEAKAHSKRVEMLAKGGLDAVLAELMEPKKLNVLDKTKADWRGVKDVDVELQEDLQHHQRGGRTHREHQDFLQQADYREYELERDARLAAQSKRGGA